MFTGLFTPTRRSLMMSAAATFAAAAMPHRVFAADPPPAALAAVTSDGPFQRSTVIEIARNLAKTNFVPLPAELPDPIKNLTYDQFRDIRTNRPGAIWVKEGLPFQLQLFHRGFYYKDEIDVAVVADDKSHHLAYSPNYFEFGKLVPQPMPKQDIGFAGLRLVSNRINRPDVFDEVAVFLGASYFRSLGRDQLYGLSARGLALKTGEPEGEEFPVFRAFWVETPAKDSDTVVVHALLDSPSVAGAYRFTIRPGLPTLMDVEASLFPRIDLKKVGLAPGTSMFYFDANGRERGDDWRPEVHDSDGLLMVNGHGERLWRPLANPRNLQISAFLDSGPRGFGLIQRNRDPKTYEDFESHYERRPSLWVEPVGDWGKGAVTLVEIPSDSEVNDNIVAFWSPQQPIAAGTEYAFAYRLSWGNEPPLPQDVGVVQGTRRGRGTLKGASPIRRFVVDYGFPDAGSTPVAVDPKAEISASAGTISDINIEANPLNGGWRLTFKLDPGTAELVELRAVLKMEDGRPMETWVYRWTA
jgi:periplasmic glucans biosynthesis protein